MWSLRTANGVCSVAMRKRRTSQNHSAWRCNSMGLED